jgi:hypothetical protein
MTNKKFWLGVLVMALVFGMSVIGCDNGGNSEPKTLNFAALRLSTRRAGGL